MIDYRLKDIWSKRRTSLFFHGGGEIFFLKVTKRRFNNSCCSQKQHESELQGAGTGTYSLSCPQNLNINNFLSSRKNLEEKDSCGFYHRWIMVISFYVGKNNQLLHKAALDVSRREQTLRVGVDNISQQRFSSLEAGVWYPNGSSQMSIGLDRSSKVAQLAANSFLHESERFQTELDKIGRCEHRIQAQLPNPSQSWALARYAYTSVKRDLWPDTSSLFHSKLKIYDNRFVWKLNSDASVGDAGRLPPWRVLTSYIADEFPVTDITGPPSLSQELNKQMLERWHAKCLFECRNLLHIPIDNQTQQNSFKSQEELGNQEIIQLNAEKKPAFRASDHINSLCELEFNLKPTSQCLSEYRKRTNNLRWSSTAYKGKTS